MLKDFLPMALQLKAARERLGLSQRAFAQRTGIQQSHLSRIERGEVDPQTSSLIQLARAADLELVLVPRHSLPAVEALSERAKRPSEHARLMSELRLQANRLVRKFPNVAVVGRLAQTLIEFPENELASLPARELGDVLTELDRARRILQAINQEPDSQPLGPAFIASIDTLEPALRASRNRIMHGVAANPAVSTPAYRLDDDDTEIS